MINHSPSSERNKAPIGEQLQTLFAQCSSILEVGSGSGQHVVHFAQLLPHIQWQPMDLPDYFPGLHHNLQQRASNILEPQPVDLSQSRWLPQDDFDGIFTANTLHIMSWQQVECFFSRSSEQLQQRGVLCVYGPFKYQGQFTSPSNAQFELWLKSRDVQSGVRDFEAVVEQAHHNGFELHSDTPMPANNQLLSFIKIN